MYTAFNVIVIFIVISMLFPDGLWSNTLAFFNALFAAMLASNYYEPLADLFESKAPTFTYIWDFLSLWLIFALTYGILSSVSQVVSKHRVRFKLPIDMGGRVVMAALVAAVVCGFFNMTMHTAPLVQNPVKGGFQSKPMDGNFLGLSPSRKWLGFMQSRSRGALAGPEEFDPNSEFVLKYGQRRKDLEVQMERTAKLRTK